MTSSFSSRVRPVLVPVLVPVPVPVLVRSANIENRLGAPRFYGVRRSELHSGQHGCFSRRPTKERLLCAPRQYGERIGSTERPVYGHLLTPFLPRFE